MSYFCGMCLTNIKKKSEYSHLKSKSHKEIEKYKHIKLSLKNIEIKEVDEILYLYMKDHMKKFSHYLLKSELNLVFIDNQDCKYLTTGLIDNKTCISWSNYLRDSIHNLKEEGVHFNYIGEMDIITLAHKRDMTYNF